MGSVVNIGGNSYYIKTGEEEDERRRAYFIEHTGKLEEPEKDLLDDLGIDELMQDSLKHYLPEFFSKLDRCGSDTALVLRSECEVPYYVVWSALFANRTETAQRLAEAAGVEDQMSTLDQAMMNATLKQLRPAEDDSYTKLFTLMLHRATAAAPATAAATATTPIPDGAAPEATTPATVSEPVSVASPTAHDAYKQLFTLMLKTPAAAENRVSDYEKLFTLILRATA